MLSARAKAFNDVVIAMAGEVKDVAAELPLELGELGVHDHVDITLMVLQ